jgi:hypothetical protein
LKSESENGREFSRDERLVSTGNDRAAHFIARGFLVGSAPNVRAILQRIPRSGEPHQMPARVVYKGSFRTSDDSGAAHLIDVFQIMHHTNDTLYGANNGLAIFRTTDGQSVYRRSKGEYEIAGTGTPLHSADSNCP